MYLTSNFYTEIQFDFHQCAHFTHCPHAIHEEAVNHIRQYLQLVQDKGLTFKLRDKIQLVCYVDTDFDGIRNYESGQYPVCVKLRNGYIMTLGGYPIQWNSKLKT